MDVNVKMLHAEIRPNRDICGPDHKTGCSGWGRRGGFPSRKKTHRHEGGGVGFDQFVAERLDRLLRYATAITCDKHLAQDIVQNVLMRAQNKWDRIGAMDVPYLYVKRMVTNDYLSWRRARGRGGTFRARPARAVSGGPRRCTR